MGPEQQARFPWISLPIKLMKSEVSLSGNSMTPHIQP
jgi:hypothetical protein